MRIQYTLKLYPAGLGRSVYRTMTICGTDTLDQLCMAILSAFDFTAEHLYEFCMDNKMYSEDCYRVWLNRITIRKRGPKRPSLFIFRILGCAGISQW